MLKLIRTLGGKKIYRRLARLFILQSKKLRLSNIIVKSKKNFIWELKKMGASYNPEYINYINYKLNNIKLEHKIQEK